MPSLLSVVITVGSKERAEHGRDFFDNDAQTQSALTEFRVQSGIGIFRAFQNVAHLRFVFGKALGVRVAWVAPVAQQALAKFWIAPDHPAIFQLGVFLKMDAINEHDVSLTRWFSRAIQCALPNRRGHGRAVRCASI